MVPILVLGTATALVLDLTNQGAHLSSPHCSLQSRCKHPNVKIMKMFAAAEIKAVPGVGAQFVCAVGRDTCTHTGYIVNVNPLPPQTVLSSAQGCSVMEHIANMCQVTSDNVLKLSVFPWCPVSRMRISCLPRPVCVQHTGCVVCCIQCSCSI